MSKSKNFDHEQLEWIVDNKIVAAKDYQKLVWRQGVTSGEVHESVRIKRIGTWLKSLLEDTKKDGKEHYWRLSRLVQEFTQRGYSKETIEADLTTIVAKLKKAKSKLHKDFAKLLEPEYRSFNSKSGTGTKGKAITEQEQWDWI